MKPKCEVVNISIPQYPVVCQICGEERQPVCLYNNVAMCSECHLDGYHRLHWDHVGSLMMRNAHLQEQLDLMRLPSER